MDKHQYSWDSECWSGKKHSKKNYLDCGIFCLCILVSISCFYLSSEIIFSVGEGFFMITLSFVFRTIENLVTFVNNIYNFTTNISIESKTTVSLVLCGFISSLYLNNEENNWPNIGGNDPFTYS